jgi:hypothetical protein
VVFIVTIVVGGLFVGSGAGMPTSSPVQQQLPGGGWRPGLQGTKQGTPSHALKIILAKEQHFYLEKISDSYAHCCGAGDGAVMRCCSGSGSNSAGS